jgi:hypothetical protein
MGGLSKRMKSVILIACLMASVWSIGQEQKDHLYIQTDKDNYVAGEMVWMKSYLISTPTIASSNLFIDLYNSSGKSVDSLILPIIGEEAVGNLHLSSALPEGLYFINCYTKDGKTQNHAKKIYVFNPYLKDSSVLRRVKTDFQFSPAYLIAGIQNTIAFKLSGEPGIEAINGTVFNSKKEAVVNFKTLYEGYGAFDLIPEAGETYFAQINSKDQQTIVRLPVPQSKGVSIQTGNTEKGKLVSINIPEALRSSQNFTLAGFMNHSLIFQKTFSAAKETYAAWLLPDSLNAGLMELVVKDQNGLILGSKTVFVNNPSSYLSIRLATDTLDLTPEGYNAYSLIFPDSTSGNFSLSIVDEEQHIHSAAANIISSMLSTSGLSCVDIATKLLDRSANNSSIIDLLANFSENNTTIAAKSDSGFITINGKAFNNRTKKVVTKGQIDFIIQTKDSSLSLVSAVIGKDGSFSLKNLVFFDTAHFTYSLKNNPYEEIIIRLDSSHADPERKIPFFQFCARDELVFNNDMLRNAALRTYGTMIKQGSSEHILKEVIVKTKKLNPKEQVNKAYTNGLFRNSNMSAIVDLINDPPNLGGTNIFDYLQGRVRGLMITRTNDGYQLTSNRKLSLFYEPPIRLYLDEQETTAGSITIVPLQDIAMVKYFPPGTSSLPGVGIAGVLAVYTKKPTDGYHAMSASTGQFVYRGYSEVRDFETENALKSNDDKGTIYWNPNIFIDGSNNVYRINFRNSKKAKRLHLIIEGVTMDGKLLHFDKVLE